MEVENEQLREEEKEQADKKSSDKDDDEDEDEKEENRADPNDLVLTEEEKQRSQDEFYAIDENCDEQIDFQELKELLASTKIIRTGLYIR